MPPALHNGNGLITYGLGGFLVLLFA